MGVADTGGLVVVAGHVDAARVATMGLHGIQHRGRDGAALAVADGVHLRAHVGAGPVASALPSATAEIMGTVAVGCVWNGEGGERLVSGRFQGGRVVATLAGRITNLSALRHDLLEDGVLMRSGSDVEVLLQLIARSKQRTFVNRLVDAVWKIEGAFVMAVCTPERLVVLRDPSGFRPAWLGRLGDAVVLSTDDGALDAVGATPQRTLTPGEMLVVDERGLQSIAPLPSRPVSTCTQEVLALAPAHSRPFGEPVHTLRIRLGHQLQKVAPADVDVVVGVPGASEEVAAGLAGAARLPFERALAEVDNPVLESTEPGVDGPRLRVLRSAVEGRRVLLVGPALGSGHRERSAIARLMAAGALAVHLRCMAPPLRLSCPYGVNTPATDSLVVSRHPDLDDLSSWLGAASVGWVSATGLEEALGDSSRRCEACLSAQLPIEVPDSIEDDQLTLFS